MRQRGLLRAPVGDTPAAGLLVLLLTLTAPSTTAQTAAEFFDDSVVQDVRLRIHPADWQRLRERFLEDTYYPCELNWRGLVTRNAGVRSRGLGSRNGSKPGLQVAFNHYEAGQEFLGLKAVVLRNNAQDPSMLREALSMLLFRRMGLAAPREAHARLSINEQYWGLYTIVESIDQAFLPRHFGENDGYLYEYRWVAPYRFEYRGSNLSRYSPLPFHPETHQRDPDPRPLEAMIRTIGQASDADFPRAVGEFLDMKEVLAHVAVENFLSETDGFVGEYGTNNFYLYRLQGKNLSRLISWDKSETFRSPGHPIFWGMQENVLTRRSLAVPQLRQAYLEALVKAAALAGGPGGWLEQEIARLYSQIRASAREDANKQCPGTGGLKPCSNEEFEAEVTRIRGFAHVRGELVRGAVAEAGFEPAGGATQLQAGGVVNSASNLAGPLAPGSLFSLYGRGFGTQTAGAAALPLPLALEGVSVVINGFAAPLLFVSPTQVNVQAPWELVPGPAPVTVLVHGVAGNTVSVNVAPVSPAIFAIVHADSSPISQDRPARAGDVLVVLANGLGPATLPLQTGLPAPPVPLARTRESPFCDSDSNFDPKAVPAQSKIPRRRCAVSEGRLTASPRREAPGQGPGGRGP